MSSTIMKATVSKRRFTISDVRDNVINKEVDQMAFIIPFDSLSTKFPLKQQSVKSEIDFIVDTQQLPLYTDFDFNEIGKYAEKDVTLVLNGIEFPCILKRESGTEPSSFFKQNFILKRSLTTPS